VKTKLQEAQEDGTELKRRAYARACPTCKALPGEDCTEVGGETPAPFIPGVSWHDTRIDLSKT